MTDPRVNDIVSCTAAQLIKTTTMNNGVAFHIVADPSSILVVYPTIDDAKDWIADKFMPMVQSSEALRKLIPDVMKRTPGQTSLVKHYPGGRLKAVGANSPASLRGRSFRIVIQDDLDGFKDNVEGDPSDLADRRAANQPRALRMKFSTPTLKGTSRIWKWLEQSTFEQLLCPCPYCGQEQTLEWEQMVWEPEKPETARYKCSACPALWTDQDRYNAVRTGARADTWRVRNPASRIKGMHMNGLYRLMGEKNSYAGFFEEWVNDYLIAKSKGEKSYQVWVNLFLALPYEPANSTIEPDPLYKRREHYNPLELLPDQVLVLVAAVDVQSNRLECEVRGIGTGLESWGVQYIEFAGDPTQQLVWKKLDAFLLGTYKHSIRGRIRIAQCFIDAGGSKQSETYVFTESRESRGIYACRGAKDLNAPMLSPLKKSGYNSVPFYFVGTQAIKDTLHSRLMMPAPPPGERAPGFFHWPDIDECGYDQDYFKKLTAEKKILGTKGIFKNKMIWVAPEGARNEPWDINVYIVAACEAAGFAVRYLQGIERDNQRMRVQMNLPPPPPSKVTKLEGLRVPPAMPPPITAADLKAGTDPAVSSSSPSSEAAKMDTPGADPNVAQNVPITPAVQHAPKNTPWKVVGKGRSSRGPSFERWT